MVTGGLSRAQAVQRGSEALKSEQSLSLIGPKLLIEIASNEVMAWEPFLARFKLNFSFQQMWLTNCAPQSIPPLKKESQYSLNYNADNGYLAK